MDAAAFSRLPEVIRHIIMIDRNLAEVKRAPIVRLNDDLRKCLKGRRALVKIAHDTWGRQQKGKK